MSKELDNYFLVEQDSYLFIDINEYNKSPEKRLLCGMCERAVRDLLSSNEEESEDARTWLEDNEGLEPFSFPWVCEALDLNREHLLQRIYRIASHSNKVRNSSRELYALIDFSNEEERNSNSSLQAA